MDDSDAADEEPHWSEVLTDVLLGCLAQPSQLWRILSKQVYRHISAHLTNEGLQLIVKVLIGNIIYPCVYVYVCIYVVCMYMCCVYYVFVL